MDALVQNGKYDSINSKNISTMGYYVIKFLPEAYTLQDDTKYDGKISIGGELVFIV